MNYCCLIFGGCYDSLIQPLEIAQRKCVRVMSCVDRQASSNPLFNNLEILKFKDIYKYQLGIYMHKNPQIGIQSSTIHNYRTRSSLLVPAFQRLELTQRQSVAFQGPSLWNVIPIEIRNSQSLSTFKHKLRKYLILQYCS